MSEQNFNQVYRRYAKVYNLIFGRIFSPGRLKAIEVADLQPGERVLEVGVGTGASLPFYPTGVKVTGIDLSPEMLAGAKRLVKEKNLKDIEELQIMNAEEMTFAENQFDCVMAMHVVSVVSDPEKFINEMRRVCKPSGRIVVVNYFHDPKRAIGKASEFIAPYSKHIGFKPDFSMDELQKIENFKIEKRVPVNLFKIWDVLVARP